MGIFMKCATCGSELEKEALLCHHCGRAVDRAEVIRQEAASRQLSKKEFYQLPGMKACRSNIKTCSIVLYVCAAITILVSVILQGFYLLSFLDGVFLILMGLWLQLGRSRVCALLVTAYGIFNTGIGLVESGRLMGWWIPLAGIWAITYTFRFHKLWSRYRKEGVIPKDAVSGEG